MKTTGIASVAAFARNFSRVANPSMPGIMASSKIRSGCKKRGQYPLLRVKRVKGTDPFFEG